MAIISGYQPAQQPGLMQPWQLPFNEMYTALKDKQSIADLEAKKSDDLMATLGNITNLLEPDLYIHKNKMNNVLVKEQELRTAVGDDLTRPEYRQGLRKLVLETATDPFYSTAMQNYQTYHDSYMKDKRALQLTGEYNEAFDDFAPDFAGYKGAINPDGTLNTLEYEGLSKVDTFLPKVQALAKDIRTKVLEGYRFNEKNQVWESYGKESLTETDIQETLWNNMRGLEMDPDFAKYRKRWMHTNSHLLQGATQEDKDAMFSQHMDEVFKGYSQVYDVDNSSVKPAAGMNDDGGAKKPVSIKDFVSVGVTTGANSSTPATPEEAKDFVGKVNTYITDVLDVDKTELETSLTKSNNGVAVTVQPTFVPGVATGDGKNPEAFSSNVDRMDFTIKDANGNIIDESSQVYKDNYQAITHLKLQYEQAHTAIDRVNEFDAAALAVSGYDPSRTEASTQKLITANKFDIAYETLDKLREELNNENIIYGLYGTDPYGRRAEDAKMIQDYNNGKISTDEYINFLYSRAALYEEALTSISSKNRTLSGKAPLKVEDVKKEVTNKKQEQLRKTVMSNDPSYARYLKEYEKAYSDGIYPVKQFSNSFGYDEDAKRFKDSLKVKLMSHLRTTLAPGGEEFRGVTVYSPTNDQELTGQEYTDLIRDMQTKAESDENLLTDINWRLDDSGDGLVVDLNYNGYTVEFRDVEGVSSYLINNNYQDYVFLNLLDDASKSMKSGASYEVRTASPNVGQTNNYGFIGDGSADFPREKFKRMDYASRVGGVEYPVGSFMFKGKMYNNMYELGIAYLQYVASQGAGIQGLTLSNQ